MASIRRNTLLRILVGVAGLLVLKVTAEVVLGYRNYFPPNFESDFLHGRDAYFFSGYQWAFYAHIASGPISLVLGLILLSERFRTRFRAWHRRLGRVQVACVVLLVAPSGLGMACFAAAGSVAAVGFAVLAIMTGATATLGWRAAANRRFADHRRWMRRCYVLLCSAVVIRLIGGAATVADVTWLWIDPAAAWASWLVPLAILEIFDANNRRHDRAIPPTHRHQPLHR